MNLKQYLRPGNGATDITPLLANGEGFYELISQLVNELKSIPISKVVAVEGRGFILGAAVAYGLKVGFVPVRYPGKLKNDIYESSFVDYSKKEKTLQIHKDAIYEGELVAVIDDWVETGATVKATIDLIEKCKGKVIKVISFMDDTSDELKEYLKRYNYSYLEHINDDDNF